MSKGGEFILPDAERDIFSVHDFTEEQLLFRDTMSEFMNKDVLPMSDKIESKDWIITKILLNELGRLGALGVEVPEQYDGAGLDKTTAAILAEEIGWQGSLAVTVLADIGIGLLPIVFFGNEEQKKRFIPGVVEGRLIGAYSLTEPGAGSDAKSIRARADLSENGKEYILNGDKIFVTNANLADYYIVFAKVGGDDKKITAFIVEKQFHRIDIGNEEHKMGIVGSSTASLKLTNVQVPIENVLGQVGEGFSIAMNILNLGRFKLGAACLGGSHKCLLESLDYSNQRKQFGKSIRNFGIIRDKLCRMSVLIYAMKSVVYRTAGLIDKAISSVDQTSSKALMEAIREYAAECSIVKVFCSEANYFIAGENIQIHGGNGFMKDYPAERHLRDSVINMIFEGTNPINRLLLVKELMSRMAIRLVQEGKKIQSEILSGLSINQDEDPVAKLEAQLKGAKKALIVGGGSIIQKLGMRLGDDDNQEIVSLIADCLIYIYVLDSALGVCAKYRKGIDQDLTRYLFNMFLPEIDKNIRYLVAMGIEGDEQRTILAAIRKLFKYSPENILELNRKIATNF